MYIFVLENSYVLYILILYSNFLFFVIGLCLEVLGILNFLYGFIFLMLFWMKKLIMGLCSILFR